MAWGTIHTAPSTILARPALRANGVGLRNCQATFFARTRLGVHRVVAGNALPGAQCLHPGRSEELLPDGAFGEVVTAGVLAERREEESAGVDRWPGVAMIKLLG